MTDMYVMPEAEFSEIEDAVQQTPRGRTFLRRYSSRERAVAVGDIERTINTLTAASTEDNDNSTHLDILRREIQEMSSAILHCRKEIASIKPEDGGDNRIMAATEELDAIVISTERATTEILSAAEVIQDTADKLAEGGASADLCDQITTQAINIMTACSFQDITGQRTTKVVKVLSYLEQRVNSMMDIWQAEKSVDTAAAAPADAEETRPDSHLLNGPQLEGTGVSQDDVDAMFDGGAEAEKNDEGEESAAPAPGQTPAVTPDETRATGQSAEPEAPVSDVANSTGNECSEQNPDAPESADVIEIELASEDVPPIEGDAPETASTEVDALPRAEEDLVISNAPLGQEEVAKLLGG